jgi:hypothetical protein
MAINGIAILLLFSTVYRYWDSYSETEVLIMMLGIKRRIT